MKKFLPIFMIAVLLLTNTLQANASEEFSEYYEMIRQEQIDSIFNELNAMAAVKANDDYLKSLGIYVNSTEEISELMSLNNNEAVMSAISCEQRELELERELESLGVHKIDVSDPEDIRILEELEAYTISYDSGDASVCSGVYDTAPDLKAVANIYTLYIYDGSVNYNGTSYSYRYIKVIDNKGYNRLTHIQELDAIASLSYAQLGTSILSYNFGYGFSLLLGSTPAGLLTDWTLGNIFNVLNNLPTAQISSSGEAIYRIFHTGVTSMTYYYLYNNGWKLIGVGASVDIVRDDYFAGNVNGSPKTDFHSVSFRTSTSGIWRDYVDAYLNNMASYPSYCQVNEIGSFTIRGYSNTLNYTPAYARNPVDLI